MRSVALNASSSSGVIREVSPDDQARQQCPRVRLQPVGRRTQPRPQPSGEPLRPPTAAATTSGGPLPRTRSTAAIRSPSQSGGTTRAVTRTRVEGSSDSQGDALSLAGRPRTRVDDQQHRRPGVRHRPVRLLDPPDLGVDQDGGRRRVVPGDPGPGEPWIGGDLHLGGHLGVPPRQRRHGAPPQVRAVQPGRGSRRRDTEQHGGRGDFGQGPPPPVPRAAAPPLRLRAPAPAPAPGPAPAPAPPHG